MNRWLVALAGALTVFVAANSRAAILTFEDPDNLGVTLGGNMTWDGTGGGHLYCESSTDDDYIIFFDAGTYVNSFDMNAEPWEDYGGAGGEINVAAYDSSPVPVELWNATVDLSNYTSWSDWLTVSVNTAGVAQLTFFSPPVSFFPSIDNLRINEQEPPSVVPEPVAWLIWCLLGAFAVAIRQRRKRKAP